MSPQLVHWFNSLTDGPWWADLSALAGIFVAFGIIVRMAIWPGLKAVWKAIVAAPRIADGVGKLVELLETDLLTRVELIELSIKRITEQEGAHDSMLSALKVRMDSHDSRADAHEKMAHARDKRISILENNLEGRI